MPNRILDMIEVAHDVYTIAVGNGLPEDCALRVARVFGAKSHMLTRNRSHHFTDEEIKTGKCLCRSCVKRKEINP